MPWEMVLHRISDGISRVPPYSGYLIRWTKFSSYGGFYPLVGDLSAGSLLLLRSIFMNLCVQLLQPRKQSFLFGLFPFRSSPLLRESDFFFLFLQGTRCFSSLRPPLLTYVFKSIVTPDKGVLGFPIRKISGIKAYYSSPKAYRR